MKLRVVILAFLVLFLPLLALADRGPDLAPAADVYNKAQRYYQAKNYAAAKEYLHQYLAEYSETPLYITCLYYLAYCYQQLNDKKEASSIYHKVINQAKGEEAFWGQMAQKRLEEIGEY